MDLQDIYQAVKDVESRVIDLIAKQAEHNAVLSEHKRYSLALQKEQELLNKELEPIKRDHYLLSMVLKGSGLVAIGVMIQWGIRKFLG